MLIVDMPMPRDCYSCDLGHVFDEKPYCRRLMKRVPRKGRHENCPIKGELVRCGECYYKEEKRIMDEDKLWCRKHHMYVTADWFCADGERKDLHELARTYTRASGKDGAE